LLCDTLNDLLKQRYDDFEILVMDQGKSHDPATEAYIEQIQECIRYFRLLKSRVSNEIFQTFKNHP